MWSHNLAIRVGSPWTAKATVQGEPPNRCRRISSRSPSLLGHASNIYKQSNSVFGVLSSKPIRDLPRTINNRSQASGNATLPIRKPSRLSSPRHGSRLGDPRSPKLFGRKQSVYRNLVLSDFSIFRPVRFFPIRSILFRVKFWRFSSELGLNSFLWFLGSIAGRKVRSAGNRTRDSSTTWRIPFTLSYPSGSSTSAVIL